MLMGVRHPNSDRKNPHVWCHSKFLIILLISKTVRHKMGESLIYLLKYRFTVAFIHVYQSILVGSIWREINIENEMVLSFAFNLICFDHLLPRHWKITVLSIKHFNNQTTRIGVGFLVGVWEMVGFLIKFLLNISLSSV